MKKKLIYYWYVPKDGWHDVLDVNLKNLNTYRHVFDEQEFVISIDSGETNLKSAQEILDILKNIYPDADFIIYENDEKIKSEAKYFYHEIIQKLDRFDDDTAVFFAHNKGVGTTYVSKDECYFWVNSMYYYNLADPHIVDMTFRNKETISLGMTKLTDYAPPGFEFSVNRWHYTGTFYWFVPSRLKAYLKEHNITPATVEEVGRYYAEGFWGAYFKPDDKACHAVKPDKGVNETFRHWLKRVATEGELIEMKALYGMAHELDNRMSTDIFVFAHRPFEMKRTNPVYKIVTTEGVDVKASVPIIRIKGILSNIGFSEWQKIFELFLNPNNLKDYVGIAHFHRFLKFSDDINYLPDMDELFENADIIIKEPFLAGNLRSQYAICHNVEDYDIMMDILKEKYPSLMKSFKDCEENGQLIDSNITIFKKKDFLLMCEFVFGVLFEYCKRVGIDIRSDESFIKHMKDNQEKYAKKHLPDDDEYLQQARICSYLAERLLMFFVYTSTNKYIALPMVNE